MSLARVKQFYKKNAKVISNYSHMTILQVANSFFYLLIYPFVINAVGIDSYGLFVFASSIATYFMVFVNFGFDMHAAKLISLHQDDSRFHAELLSTITVAKIALGALSAIIFLSIAFTIPFIEQHSWLFWICFLNIFSSIFLPMWYFHGLQKMKMLTIIQLSLKLLSLPLIYFTINSGGGIIAYTEIVVLTNVFSSLAAFLLAIKLSRRLPSWPGVSQVKNILFEVQPFFWSTAINTFKQKSIEVIIGALFGMKEVAVYDLANKIFSVPSLLASNINAALFPMMVKKASKDLINKIIKIEIAIGVLCMLSVAFGGYWVVDLISVHKMDQAYYLAMMLSVNIMTFLVVGSHIYFIFVPHQRYDFVLRNQLVSVLSFYLFCALYLTLSWSIYSVVLALVSSALLEILYSWSLVKKVEGY